MWGTGAYFNGTLYYAPVNAPLQAFPLLSPASDQPTQIGATPVSQSQTIYSYPGATPGVSANGATNGIVWTIEGAGTGQAILHAYDAANLANELYHSAQVPDRDAAGGYVKFTTPTIANGKVYVGGQSSIAIFGSGLRLDPVTITPGSGSYFPSVTATLAETTPGAEIHYTTDGSLPTLASPRYTGPLTLTSTTVLSARAFKAGYIPTALAQANYQLDAGVGSGDGLNATYFDQYYLAGNTFTRIDPNLNFSWDGVTGPAPGIPPTLFSARWTGKIQPRDSGLITFNINYDDGARVWIDNQLVINCWLFPDGYDPTPPFVTLPLIGGKLYDIKVELWQGGGGAGIQLFWSDALRPQEIVPQSQLYTGATLLVPAPQIAPEAGNFYPTAAVSISDALAGAEIHYTLDGSVPTLASPRYTGPLTLTQSATVTAKAFKDSYTDSPAVSAAYVYNPALAAPTYAIDSGSDQDVLPFKADTLFTGGEGHTRFGQVDTHLAVNPAPGLVYQSERIGDFSYVLPNLVPGGLYLARLHFAENVYSGAGQRVFNVAINGQPVLTNFDIYAAAGGSLVALVREFTAIADATGTITIQYTSVVGKAKASGFEILAPLTPVLTAKAGNGSVALNWPGDSNSPVYTVRRGTTPGGPYTTLATGLTATSYTDTTAVNGTVYYYIVTALELGGIVNSTEAFAAPYDPAAAQRVNCGGPALGLFQADTGFSGTTQPLSTASAIDAAQAPNAALSGVYQTQRAGDMTYTFANLTPNAAYAIRLHFAEIEAAQAGQRVFSATANGKPIVTNFDIFAAANSANRALVANSVAAADASGTIAVTFAASVGKAACAGIEIVSAPDTLCGTVQLGDLAATAPPQSVTFEFRPVSGSSFQRTALIGTDGAFCFTGLPRQSYNVWVKGAKYLAQVVAADLSQSSVTNFRAALGGGDTNNDNTVDIMDFGVIVNAYGADVSDPTSGYDLNADLNSDGMIDVLDFGILINSYGEKGSL